MPSWELTNVAHDLWVERIELNAQALGYDASRSARVAKRVMRGGVSDGVDVLCVDNGSVELTLLPTRGMGIWRGRAAGEPIGWNSPVRGPVHPAYVRLGDRNGLGWLEGFDECMCRCGLSWNGAACIDQVRDNTGREISVPLSLHGRIANLPAHRVTVHSDPKNELISIEGEVDERGMFGEKLRLETCLSTRLCSNVWSLRDRVTNCGGEPVEMALLYHWNFGPPLLEADARLRLPFKRVMPRDERSAAAAPDWDRYAPPAAGRDEACFFAVPLADDQGWTRALLHTADARRGVSIGFNLEQLPCFSLWHCCSAIEDGYVTGLEPGTNYPNPRPTERAQGRIPVLEPGACRTFEQTFHICTRAEEVQAEIDRIAAIQAG